MQRNNSCDYFLSFASVRDGMPEKLASSLRKILPVTVFGITSTNWTPPCKCLYFDTFSIKINQKLINLYI